MLFGRRKKNPIILRDKGVVDWKYATCGYCSTGCAMEVGLDKDGKAVTTRGVADAPVNRGKLCIKGITEAGILDAAGRGTEPLLRGHTYDPWQTVSWDAALDKTAAEFQRIQEKYGRDSVAVVSTGQILTEEFYTLGKLVRGIIGTNNYDGNTTLCMASAVSGYKRSFGSDGPPGCYDDFSHTDCLLAFGSNLPEQHPVIYWRLKEALEERKFPIIVVDPRVTMFAQFADIHLPITPGTDLVLLNSLCHVILKEGLADEDFIAAHTNGREAFAALVDEYNPGMAAKITGIDEDTIRHVARLYASAGAAMSIWTMGINQSTHGSDGVCAINNLNLITGNIGKPGGTSLSITGQCNAMGTREWSSCSGLPGYRALENPAHREEIGQFWGVDPEFFPKQRGRFMTDIFPAIETGEIKALWLVATNPMTSMPNTGRIRKILEKLEFCVVQDAYQDVEATQYAHAYFPASVWAEKDGCFTNTERRVNRVTPVTAPLANSKPDLWIFNQLAKRWEQGARMNFPESASDVFEEMKLLSVGTGANGAPRMLDISGMNHALIEQQRGIQWPMRAGDETGAARLYSDGVFQFPDGRAKLLALPWTDNNEKPDTDFPFWLNSGRVVEHFHTRTRTGKVGNCNKFSPTAYMEMNPDAAREIGVEHMQYVRLVSRRGDAIVLAQLTQRVPRNMVFVPFHFHDCVNRVSLGLLDPHSRQPAFKQAAVRIEQVDQAEAARLNREMRAY
ncbi:molybdopterin oxidoreductase family protein [Parahaliea aestuarii]|uniref:Nitrate reductase n=1 Tax=Parahaliea aestuarii TaxID=1852021 RepID=A0A5C8ZY95_9GAMM|nr:nitrate reductase [Parahaliea aestuarii]TXS93476.1 nitrate reductase [Parahaliea aestuarii]